MNKFITIPMVVIALLNLAGVVQGYWTFDNAWIWGYVAIGIAAISVASLLLKDTVLSALWKQVVLGGVWVGMTFTVLWMFTDAGMMGTVFYSGLTIVFCIGLFMDVDGGGD